MDRDGTGRMAGVAALLLLGLAVGALPGGASHGSPLVAAAQEDPDDVLLRAKLHPDGSATWTVEYLVRLDDENATAAFESLVEDIEANRSAFETRFRERMRPTLEAAENATGREMAIRNVTVDTGRQTIGQEYGVVTYAFVWEGFAVADGPRVRAGDAIAGLFLDSETALRIAWPEEYRRVSVEPDPHATDENSVSWRGQFDFGDDEPLVVVTSAPPPTTIQDGTTTAGTSPGAPDGGGLSLLPIVALVVLAAIGAAGWLYVRRGGEDGGAPATAGGDGGDTGGEGDRPPEELLSNEERVLALLEERGGRMKQQDVAEELDWTDAKTSQVVSSLRDDGEIESFRLGRENVLTLPDHDLAGGDPREGDEGENEG